MQLSVLFGKSRRIPDNMNDKLCLTTICKISEDTYAVGYEYWLQCF